MIERKKLKGQTKAVKKRVWRAFIVVFAGAAAFLADGDAQRNIDVCPLGGEAEIVSDEGLCYYADEVVVPSIHPNRTHTVYQMRRESEEGLPSYFDAREAGYVTPVKEQDNNMCWTYSIVSLAESDLIAGNTAVGGEILTNETADLSEDHLAYFFYHTPQDEMGNTAGDQNIALTDYLLAGGNHIFTTFALANWVGLAKEEADIDWESAAHSFADHPDDVHMQNAYWINLNTDADEVKRMILQHGSAAISLYYSSAYLYGAAYYNSGVTVPNHAAVIVGWDDAYSRENFRRTPENDGAWLVKNSYGKDSGDGGYFWMSYEDAALNADSAKAFVFAFEDAGNYDHIYQYDGSAGAYMDPKTKDTGSTVADGGAVANVFTVPADTKTRYQTLEAVSFALYDINVEYRIQIYKNPSDASNPSSGDALLKEPVTGQTSFVGYYTVKLPGSLLLNAGDTFSVVVELAKEDGGKISYFVDKTYTNGSWISFVNHVGAGESFSRQNGAWKDLVSEGVTARVKAFTKDYVENAESIWISEKILELEEGESAALRAEVLPERASYRQIRWSALDPSIADVDENGVVTAKKAGSTVITAEQMFGTAPAMTCAVTVRQKVTEKKPAGQKTKEKKKEQDSDLEQDQEKEKEQEQPALGKTDFHESENEDAKKERMLRTKDSDNAEAWALVMLFASMAAAATKRKRMVR